ncbi:glycosyltransferase family 2 protein [Vibrio cholerae]|nr:glycosyltransferase family 2 protein [Vibrio cholerae]MBN7286567.1 glycosyltransferase [Vibrio paracholerae]EGR1402299.1 glycosyltransferase family 2 protein [Vibrio cholerae]EGR1428810.1 glycosyltransferase family 2 protein [Vibrio cholerae]EHE6926355.1 glycosyltransferase family 2 protein [Vibrio cholerae]EJX7572134.1 glycosyltransferase family 2 protein [Vibrio cholerae]
MKDKKIAVVIPTYRVLSKIGQVLIRIPDYVSRIYIVDDCCDQGSGKYVAENFSDSRIEVLFHTQNQGVGGAVITGYRKAIEENMDIVVKIDGDNQMDPSLIPKFLIPLIEGEADYTKGNRFYNFSDSKEMPKLRLFGNIGLSFLTKLSSGYWKNFDPTNGYTAITVDLLRNIPLEKLSKRYFFESDMLFRLCLATAKVMDIPMTAVYGDEQSNLHIRKIFWPFLKGNLRNFAKRVSYKYFLQDFNMASLELCFGLIFMLFGLIFGGVNWIQNSLQSVATPVGTIIISALSIIVGFQLFLSFLSYDISNYPDKAISPRLSGKSEQK